MVIRTLATEVQTMVDLIFDNEERIVSEKSPYRNQSGVAG